MFFFTILQFLDCKGQIFSIFYMMDKHHTIYDSVKKIFFIELSMLQSDILSITVNYSSSICSKSVDKLLYPPGTTLVLSRFLQPSLHKKLSCA